MWRVLWMSLGLSAVILGGECMVLDKVILAHPGSDVGDEMAFTSIHEPKSWTPPDWAPWGLIGTGAVLIITSGRLAKND